MTCYLVSPGSQAHSGYCETQWGIVNGSPSSSPFSDFGKVTQQTFCAQEMMPLISGFV